MPFQFIDILIILVFRVHWLRAKARFDRWSEEKILVSSEMDWTVNYFNYRSEQWRCRQGLAKENQSNGHVSYAARQESMWKELALDAKVHFDKARL